MLILLTNDDGITAPGLVAMYHALLPMGEVHVVAPDTVQSATSHGVTLSAPLMTYSITVPGAFTGTSVAGRPADCVKLAVAKILPRRPDLVISGINSGANVGINVLYSGTVAAAVEAAFLGLPAIALSQYLKGGVPIDYARSATWARETIQDLLAAGLAPGDVATVNLPALQPGQSPAGAKVVRQCINSWADTYEHRKDPRGRDYFWNTSVFTLGSSQADTDVAALRDGYITITPLQFDLTRYDLLSKWQEARLTHNALSAQHTKEGAKQHGR